MSNERKIRRLIQGGDAWKELFFVLLLIVLGLYLRRSLFSNYMIFLEGEFSHLFAANQPTVIEAIKYSSRFAHPPLGFIILHWLALWNHSVEWLRLISLIPGVALIPAFYLLGRLSSGIAGAVLLSVVASMSFALLEHSMVIRTYMLMLFLVTIGLCCLLLYDRTVYRRWLAGYCIACALALATHFSTLFIVASIGLAWLPKVLQRRNRDIVLWVGIHFFFILIFVAFYALSTFGLKQRFPTDQALTAQLLQLIAFYFDPLPISEWWVFVPLLCLGLFQSVRKGKVEFFLFFLIGVGGLIFASYGLNVYPLAGNRRCLFALFYFCLPLSLAGDAIFNSARRIFARFSFISTPVSPYHIVSRLGFCGVALIVVFFLTTHLGEEYHKRAQRSYHFRFLLKDYDILTEFLTKNVSNSDHALGIDWHSKHWKEYELTFRRKHQKVFSKMFVCVSKPLAYQQYRTIEQWFRACLPELQELPEIKRSEVEKVWLVIRGRLEIRNFLTALENPSNEFLYSLKHRIRDRKLTPTGGIFAWNIKDLTESYARLEDKEVTPRKSLNAL